MKSQNNLFVAASVVCCIFITSTAFAKTAKECTAEWRADKAGMQARGTTEKAYVAQCKGAAEPNAAAPSAKPADAQPPALRQATSSGTKTAKDCLAEWRADKVGMKARGVTEKAYVEQCKGGSPPAASAPELRPTAAAPVPAPQTNARGSQKTAKECVAEWRADKAAMQARGTTEKAYVEQCRAGSTTPTSAAPEPRPTAAAPAPSQATPTETQAAPAPAPAPRRPTANTAAAPTQQPSAPNSTATLEAGQFADAVSAKASCPSDTIVWVNLPSKIYHFEGTKNYGTTKHGAYMCEKAAIAGENRASKTETHP